MVAASKRCLGQLLNYEAGLEGSVQPSLIFNTGMIKLTYMCGNRFRVRNSSEAAVTLTWDVYGTTDRGGLSVGPKTTQGPYRDTFFTTGVKGTTRLFWRGQLIQTKANGNKSC
jgi:hypothetical protein